VTAHPGGFDPNALLVSSTRLRDPQWWFSPKSGKR
jgi:hypothetical protein